MKKRIVLIFLSTFCISMFSYGIDAWIRINQLGYLPNAQKKAILLSESPLSIKQFSLYDALTNEELGNFTTITSFGDFQLFRSTYILDFSTFKLQGAFYIKAGLIYSPTIYINKNTYLGAADFLLNYIRQQRFTPSLKHDHNQPNEYVVSGEENQLPDRSGNIHDSSGAVTSGTKLSERKTPKKSIQIENPELKHQRIIDIQGGWHETSTDAQYGATSANSIYQMLFAYQMNPASFADKYDASGNDIPNGIPDILDEAKWGLDWLVKMYPEKEVLYHQIGPDCDLTSLQYPSGNKTKPGTGRPVYKATGKPQGLFKYKNRSTGVASIAGKYASAFGLGAELLHKFYPIYADSLAAKAKDAYQYGRKDQGVCQTVPGESPFFLEEDNWTDDMELAAGQLYRQTYDGNYLKEAADYGRSEPVTPWMCSDTARHYQWYPFVNLGHFMLANVENPRYRKEFLENMRYGIHRMSLQARENPFKIGVPFIRGSNNLVVALATQCRLYRTLTNDSTYMDMETSLVDWLWGCNPWGVSMIEGQPKIGFSTSVPNSDKLHQKCIPGSGGLIAGPVYKSIYNTIKGTNGPSGNNPELVQSDFPVYHPSDADDINNAPTLDGTTSLTYLLSGKQQDGVPEKTTDNNQYAYGGITRTDKNKKQISLVFTGNEYADGYKIIRKTLKKLNMKASFFFTGDFYRCNKNKHIIKGLQKDRHYLGGNSDKHLLYCSWIKRDSLLVSKSEFLTDLEANYKEMAKFGLLKNQTPFFMPPFECYNDSISLWCKEAGLQLVNYTPGTLSDADNSIPEMRGMYYSSNEIYNKILQVEAKQGLNGYIMLFHLGTDKRRQDKFYPRLYALLSELSKSGYNFVDMYQSTDTVDKNVMASDKKQKRKN